MGEHDGLFDRSAQNELVRRIRGSRLVAYPEIGHAPHWEDPARFLADFEAFLNEPAASDLNQRLSSFEAATAGVTLTAAN